MRAHSRIWNQMSGEDRDRYAPLAIVHQSQREAALRGAVGEADQRLQLLRGRAAAEQAACKPLIMSSCTFGPDEQARFSSLLDSGAFTHKTVADLRQRALRAPAPPSKAELLRLASLAPPAAPPQAKPSWAAALCKNRDDFHNTALVTQRSGQRLFWKFHFALQQPHFASFSPMEVTGGDLEGFAPVVSHAQWLRSGQNSWHRVFEVDLHTVVGFEAVCAEIDNVEVLTSLWHAGGTTIMCDSEPIPLAHFLPPKPAAGASAAPATRAPAAKKATVTAEMLAANPWLEGFLGSSGVQETQQAHPDNTPAEAPEDDEGMDDDRLLALFAELETRRAAEALVEVEPSAFRAKLLGGDWLIAERSKAFDAWQGACRTKQSERWCVQYTLPKSARFELTFYGDVVAAALARGWCHRMEYFYNLWIAAGSGSYSYTKADVAGYQEPADFIEAAQGFTGKKAARVSSIRSLAPR